MNPALEAWFNARGWAPFPFQREAWAAYERGESGLIHASTGMGKTYAVWMGIVNEWLNERDRAPSSAGTHPLSLRVLWLTPLRALAADTEESLRQVVDDLALPFAIESRTGDTSAAVRSRQRRRLPTALVTTPESLSLLLSHESVFNQFRSLRLVVVDEWHELLSSKRGTQTELALARLRRWNPPLCIWGLSATMGDLALALRALIGIADFDTGEVPRGRLIQGEEMKAIRIHSLIPPVVERFPWAGHLGLRLLPQVISTIESGRTALVFTNTRAQTEIWYQAILEAKPEWAGEIALHHGSLDKRVREWVEDGLRHGRLRCVVCTSSLDLGVDFTPVDSVLQVGSPKRIGRLLQRAGRSGHQPGAESRVTCVPTHALELVETAAVRAAAASGIVEARPPVERPLDVLAQHMVTLALGGGFDRDELFREVRTAYAYRDLSEAEFRWTLDFVTTGGGALRAYPEYSKVTVRDGRYIVEDSTVARTHRMSIGTIMNDAALKVQYLRGGEIGYVDESFLSRLQPGDKFTLNGKILEFVRIREMTAWVRAARSRRGLVPRWLGGTLPISPELTAAVRDQLETVRAGDNTSPELEAVRPILDLQAKWSRIPARDELLIERTHTRDGYHLFIYPFEGRLVHEGLAALLAMRIGRQLPITFTVAVNDYGFELLSADPPPLDNDNVRQLFSPDHLADDILRSLNAAELSKWQFREIARIAGLVIQRFPGGQKTTKQLQASTGLLYDVFAKYDPENLLLQQAAREVLERQLEIGRLSKTLGQITEQRITILDTRRPTPFAFPLLVERVRQTVSSESLADRVEKMQLALQRDFEREEKPHRTDR